MKRTEENRSWKFYESATVGRVDSGRVSISPSLPWLKLSPKSSGSGQWSSDNTAATKQTSAPCTSEAGRRGRAGAAWEGVRCCRECTWGNFRVGLGNVGRQKGWWCCWQEEARMRWGKGREGKGKQRYSQEWERRGEILYFLVYMCVCVFFVCLSVCVFVCVCVCVCVPVHSASFSLYRYLVPSLIFFFVHRSISCCCFLSP